MYASPPVSYTHLDVYKRQDADYVIAADAGYENACRVGVEPYLLLGDYGSAPRPEAGADVYKRQVR